MCKNADLKSRLSGLFLHRDILIINDADGDLKGTVEISTFSFIG